MPPLSWSSSEWPVVSRVWSRSCWSQTGAADRIGGIWDEPWDESLLSESVLKAIEQEWPGSTIFNICLLTFTVLSSLQER